MTLAELTPDMALKALLDGKVKAGAKALKVYAQGEQPNTGADAEYISIQWNGSARSRSQRLGVYQGQIALIINCKLYSNATVNTIRVTKIIGQLQGLIHRKRSNGFVFTFNPMNVITPTTPNLTNGYSTTTLNVDWHT